jgi:hypothetical protein
MDPIVKSARVIAPLVGEQRAKLDRFAAALESVGHRQYAIRSDVAPSDQERAFLVEREADMRAYLEPCTDLVGVIRDISVMMAMMAVNQGPELETEAMLELFAGDLKDLPAWAIRQACQNFRRGIAGHPPFAPKVSEVRREAMRIMAPLADELAKTSKVLSAKVEPANTEAERERVRAEFERLKAAFAATHSMEAASRRRTADLAMPELDR